MKFAYIAFAYFTLFTLGFIDNARGPIYPQFLDYFGVSNALGSWVFTLSSLCSFLTALLAKFWLPRIGIITASKIALFAISFRTIAGIFVLLFMIIRY